MVVHTATVRGRRLSWDAREVVQPDLSIKAVGGDGATASIAANYIVIVYE